MLLRPLRMCCHKYLTGIFQTAMNTPRAQAVPLPWNGMTMISQVLARCQSNMICLATLLFKPTWLIITISWVIPRIRVLSRKQRVLEGVGQHHYLGEEHGQKAVSYHWERIQELVRHTGGCVVVWNCSASNLPSDSYFRCDHSFTQTSTRVSI